MMNALRSHCIFSITLFVCFGFSSAQHDCPEGSGLGLNNTCQVCEPGTIPSSFECTPCSPDRFQPLPGQTLCLRCPPGTRSGFGFSTCVTCGGGQAAFPNGTCRDCPAGEQLASFTRFSLSCIRCPRGFFKDEVGPGPCLPCPPGTFAIFGAVECIPCPENQALRKTDGSCGQCAPGAFFNDFTLTCEECPAGSFTNVSNVLRRCFPCGGNSFASGGASSCIPCPIGQVFLNSTQSCKVGCEPGFVYNESALDCEPCRFNSFSRGGTQTFCSSCLGGSFSRMGSSTCFPCPFGLNFIADIDGCGACPEGVPYDPFGAQCGPITSLPSVPSSVF